MHHARKLYKTAPKKQRRQMICPNVIPSLKMKTLRDKKSYDAEHLRHTTELHHEHSEEGSAGGPVDMGDQGFRQAMRGAREVHHGPESLMSSS